MAQIDARQAPRVRLWHRHVASSAWHFALCFPKESVDGFFRYDEYVWSLWQKWTLVWIADSPLSAGHVVQFWFDKDHIHVLLRSQ